MLVAVAREAQLDLILAIAREVVPDQHAAAGAERQSGHVRLLGEVRLCAVSFAARHPRRRSEREPGHLAGRVEVAVQQQRGERAEGDVVEAEARFILRQQRGRVDLQRQQVTDRVLVLGAVEAAQRVGATGVGRGRRGAIQRADKLGHRLPVGLLGGPRLTERWHLPVVHLSHDRLPAVGGRLGPRRIQRLKIETALPHPGAVTVEAVGAYQLGRLTGRRNAPRRRDDGEHGGKDTESHTGLEGAALSAAAGVTQVKRVRRDWARKNPVHTRAAALRVTPENARFSRGWLKAS